jgi:hypothetical protein
MSPLLKIALHESRLRTTICACWQRELEGVEVLDQQFRAITTLTDSSASCRLLYNHLYLEGGEQASTPPLLASYYLSALPLCLDLQVHNRPSPQQAYVLLPTAALYTTGMELDT